MARSLNERPPALTDFCEDDFFGIDLKTDGSQADKAMIFNAIETSIGFDRLNMVG
jgi:hypothetical protein